MSHWDMCLSDTQMSHWDTGVSLTHRCLTDTQVSTAVTDLLLMQGMLMQLAAATAAKGTNRPIKGGNF